MKKSIVVIALILAFFLNKDMNAQDSFKIYSEGDKIHVKIDTDGERFHKTYNNWNEVKADRKLRKYSKEILSENGIDIEGDNLQVNILPSFLESLGMKLEIDLDEINIDADDLSITIERD